jgi:putative ABC transport system substrate-binding protein
MTVTIGRRELLAALGARAQQGTPVVGVLRINPKGSDIFAEPFGRYMQAAGWVEGRNVHYDFVWADMRIERMHALANELVARNVNLIVTSGDPAIRAVQQATSRPGCQRAGSEHGAARW